MIASGGSFSTSATEPLPEAPSVGACEEASLHSPAFGRVSQLVQSSLVLQDDNCWHPN